MNADSQRDRRARSAGLRLVKESIRLSPKPFAVAVTGASLFAALTVASSWALGRVVDRIVVPVFRGVDVPGSTIAAVVGVYLAVALLRSGAVVMRRAVAARWQNDVAAIHRRNVVHRFLHQPLAWVRRRSTGDLLAASDSDPEAIVQLLAPLPASIGSILLMVLAAGWLLAIDLVLGAIAIVVIPLIAVANIVFTRKADAPAERIQEAVADLSGAVHETVDGIAVVKVLGAQQQARDATTARINTLRKAKLHQIKLLIIFDAALNLIPSVLSILLIVTGAYRARAGAVTVGEVVGVVQLFERLIWPLRMLAWTAAGLPRAMVGRERIGMVVDVPLERLPPSPAPHDPKNVIELHGVGVVHDDGRVALEGVDLPIRRGSRVAIVGPTGSGKTTLMHVLAGIDSPTAGETRRAADADATLVFQEPLLFSGSLRDNVALGASVDAQLDMALGHSRADEFVSTFDDGLDTIVGERGVTLSGGQRQRIALSRALARRPSVLLLDDTTSALDPATEADVLAALRDRAVAETVVMVAARPSSIALADDVVLLDNGRIIDRGTHEELVARSPLYREIVTAYSLEQSHA